MKKEWILWLILAAPLAYLAAVWNDMPAIVRTHWDSKNHINGYASKYTCLLLPGINILLYFLFKYLPRLDPRKVNYQFFEGPYLGICLSICGLLSLIGMATTNASLTARIDFINYLPAFICLFFSVMGIFIGKVKSNYFIGIRTPWTLESNEVWDKTHAMAGKVWLYGGIAFGVLCFLAGQYAFFVFIPVILILAFAPVIYSYVLYRKIKKNNNVMQ